jgi:hypothetical protein
VMYERFFLRKIPKNYSDFTAYAPGRQAGILRFFQEILAGFFVLAR